MKKIVTFILLLCMAFSLTSCVNNESATAEITVQDLYDSTNIPALLENHDSVYVLYTENGEVYQLRVFAPVNSFNFFKVQKFILNQQFQIDKVRITRKGGEAGIGTVAQFWRENQQNRKHSCPWYRYRIWRAESSCASKYRCCVPCVISFLHSICGLYPPHYFTKKQCLFQ